MAVEYNAVFNVVMGRFYCALQYPFKVTPSIMRVYFSHCFSIIAPETETWLCVVGTTDERFDGIPVGHPYENFAVHGGRIHSIVALEQTIAFKAFKSFMVRKQNTIAWCHAINQLDLNPTRFDEILIHMTVCHIRRCIATNHQQFVCTVLNGLNQNFIEQVFSNHLYPPF